MARWLKPGTEFRFGPSNPFCNGTQPAMFFGEERDDSISLTQFLGAQYQRLISIHRHGHTVTKEVSEVRDLLPTPPL